MKRDKRLEDKHFKYFEFWSHMVPKFSKTEALFLSWLMNRGKVYEIKMKKRRESGIHVAETYIDKGWFPCNGNSIKKGLPIFSSEQVCWNMISSLSKQELIKTRNIGIEAQCQFHGVKSLIKTRHIKVDVGLVYSTVLGHYDHNKGSTRYTDFNQYMRRQHGGPPSYYKIYFGLVHYLKKPEKIVYFHWMLNNYLMKNYWMGVKITQMGTGLSKNKQNELLREFQKEGLVDPKAKIQVKKGMTKKKRIIGMNLEMISDILSGLDQDL